ncbi:MAG: hypothetical protein DGJ47_000633, partial [Rickettsiaceae bacterium]
EELANQLKSRNALESKRAWQDISTARMMQSREFSKAFNNDILSEAEDFIEAIDFSVFGLADKAIFSIIRNNLFFVHNLKLHNISFDQLKELIDPEQQESIKVKLFERINKVIIIDTKSVLDSRTAAESLCKKMRIRFQLIEKETVTLDANMAKQFKLFNDDNTQKINVQDKDGNSKLHHAVILGRLQKVKSLLDLGIDDSLRNNNGKTALDLAEDDNKKIEIYQLLADYQPEIFWAAIRAKKIKEAVKMASTISLAKLQLPVKSMLTPQPPIYLAVENEKLTDLASMLVKRGVKFSDKDSEGNNILHRISRNYSKDSALDLIHQIISKYKAINLSLDEQNKDHHYPADIVAMQGKKSLLLPYIQEGYSFTTYNHSKSTKDNLNLELVVLAHKNGITIDVKDLIKGFDFSKQNLEQKNILEICAKAQNWPLFNHVIQSELPSELRAQLEEENIWDENGYHLFAHESTEELARLYKKYNFDVSLEEVITQFSRKKVNEHGNSLIYEILKTVCTNEMQQKEKADDFQIAMQHEAVDINYTERENGRTPLHYAVGSKQTYYAKELVKNGADKVQQGKFNKTAYDLEQMFSVQDAELLSLLDPRSGASQFDHKPPFLGGDDSMMLGGAIDQPD